MSEIDEISLTTIFLKLIGQYKVETKYKGKAKELAIFRRKLSNIRFTHRWSELKKDDFIHCVELMVNSAIEKGSYTVSFYPSVISFDQARNFYMNGERRPSNDIKDELWKSLYLMISGVYAGDTIVNLDNIDDEGRKMWRKLFTEEVYLKKITEKRLDLGLDIEKLSKELNLKMRFRIGPLYLSLLLIGFFVKKLKEAKNTVEDMLGTLESLWKFREDTLMVVYDIPLRKKKRMYYIPRVSSLITRFFRGFLEDPNLKTPPLLRYIDSLSMLTSSKKYDELEKIREAFTYYLLIHHKINGELLNKWILLKVEDSTRTGKFLPFSYAERFFANISI